MGQKLITNANPITHGILTPNNITRRKNKNTIFQHDDDLHECAKAEPGVSLWGIIQH